MGPTLVGAAAEGTSTFTWGRSSKTEFAQGEKQLTGRYLERHCLSLNTHTHTDAKLTLCVYTGTCLYVSNTWKKSGKIYTKTKYLAHWEQEARFKGTDQDGFYW